MVRNLPGTGRDGSNSRSRGKKAEVGRRRDDDKRQEEAAREIVVGSEWE
jgi:hypothetical protein